MRIESPKFENKGDIPEKYTCDGQDISPPLSLEDVSSDAVSISLVVDDPDAPGGTFDHWIIWNIDPSLDSVPEDVPNEETVEDLGGAVQGKNGFGELGYRGPCPPPGPKHKYRFKAFALDEEMDLEPGAMKGDLQEKMDGHVLSEDVTIGFYGR